MKVQVQVKMPDIDECIRDKYEFSPYLTPSKANELETLISKYIKHREYITLEIDLENKQINVVKLENL